MLVSDEAQLVFTTNRAENTIGIFSPGPRPRGALRRVLHQTSLSGAPDVVFLDRVLTRLYVAVGDPGTIDVFDTRTMERLGSVATERGAHTFALGPGGDCVYAFLPATHRAAIYEAVR